MSTIHKLTYFGEPIDLYLRLCPTKSIGLLLLSDRFGDGQAYLNQQDVADLISWIEQIETSTVEVKCKVFLYPCIEPTLLIVVKIQRRYKPYHSVELKNSEAASWIIHILDDGAIDSGNGISAHLTDTQMQRLVQDIAILAASEGA